MSPKSNNLSILGIIGFVILLGAVGFLLINNSALKKELKEKKSDYLELEKIHTELDQNYASALKDLEDLRGDNQELNELIDKQVDELAKQKKRISGLIWTERELGKARTEMDNLNKMVEQYIKDINTLKKENANLLAENENLNDENSSLSQELMVNKERMNDMDSMQRILVATTEELNEDNAELSNKVDIAEAIKINFIDVKGLDDKGDGKFKEKGKAKRVEVLRSCFTTETNVVTQSGDHEFFVRLTSPAGEVLYVEELGSGVIKNKMTGEKVRYTTSGIVDYKNEELTACFREVPTRLKYSIMDTMSAMAVFA